MVNMKTEIDRFWSHVDKDGPIAREGLSPCWVWTAWTNHNGYGLFHFGGSSKRVHRISFSFSNSIPDGMKVLHTCDVRNCVNPEHLFLGTSKDNAQDCIAKGRFVFNKPRGEKHYAAKLTTVDVIQMRQMHALGVGFYKLGKYFRISKVAAKKAVLRKTWKHVK